MIQETIDLTVVRVCTTCKIGKSLPEFGRRNGKAKFLYGRDSMCKKCKAEYEYNRVMLNPEKKAKMYACNAKWRSRNPGRYKGWIFPSKWKSLGIEFTKEQYYDMLEKQNGVCAICQGIEKVKEKTIALSVDHDHKTKKVRGLLCGNCNRGIGLLKDDSETLFKASLYLKNNG